MDRDGIPGGLPMPENLGSKITTFIQQQIQSIFQSIIPHMVQQISKQVAGIPRLRSPSTSSREMNERI